MHAWIFLEQAFERSCASVVLCLQLVGGSLISTDRNSIEHYWHVTFL